MNRFFRVRLNFEICFDLVMIRMRSREDPCVAAKMQERKIRFKLALDCNSEKSVFISVLNLILFLSPFLSETKERERAFLSAYKSVIISAF